MATPVIEVREKKVKRRGQSVLMKRKVEKN
jgi:hypothetical protein